MRGAFQSRRSLYECARTASLSPPQDSLCPKAIETSSQEKEEKKERARGEEAFEGKVEGAQEREFKRTNLQCTMSMKVTPDTEEKSSSLSSGAISFLRDNFPLDSGSPQGTIDNKARRRGGGRPGGFEQQLQVERGGGIGRGWDQNNESSMSLSANGQSAALNMSVNSLDILKSSPPLGAENHLPPPPPAQQAGIWKLSQSKNRPPVKQVPKATNAEIKGKFMTNPVQRQSEYTPSPPLPPSLPIPPSSYASVSPRYMQHVANTSAQDSSRQIEQAQDARTRSGVASLPMVSAGGPSDYPPGPNVDYRQRDSSSSYRKTPSSFLERTQSLGSHQRANARKRALTAQLQRRKRQRNIDAMGASDKNLPSQESLNFLSSQHLHPGSFQFSRTGSDARMGRIGGIGNYGGEGATMASVPLPHPALTVDPYGNLGKLRQSESSMFPALQAAPPPGGMLYPGLYPQVIQGGGARNDPRLGATDAAAAARG
eukprot:CAMPEP_0184500164 /NCGR_PEP_ID=MMETSP0113_2-20130426/43858_1 /TAXON_ID=91329 /ORGANISM="Norrisiella sphaerica, Strain BC52" /LENGTH=484 /DNA_ID=CAMNT_0026888407 /DNA_START=121 /DNA_END=1571 /DNA_ORIENTATION=-